MADEGYIWDAEKMAKVFEKHQVCKLEMIEVLESSHSQSKPDSVKPWRTLVAEVTRAGLELLVVVDYEQDLMMHHKSRTC